MVKTPPLLSEFAPRGLRTQSQQTKVRRGLLKGGYIGLVGVCCLEIIWAYTGLVGATSLSLVSGSYLAVAGTPSGSVKIAAYSGPE